MSKVDYEIFEQIGKGLRGNVFRGLDIKNKREVAIKKVLTTPNTNKEIHNHLLLNNINIVPKLYDYFEELENEKKVTYMVQQIIIGKGLHITWKNNKNWDFIWMTVYHALKAIEEFHNYGYIHGDLHLNNFVWSGDKMWLIDFDKMIDVPNKLKELENDRTKLKYSNDHDLLSKIDDQIFDLNKGYGFCEDYVNILSTSPFSRLGDYRSFNNFNNGYERYILLIDYQRNNKCRNYNDFSKIILKEYNIIDNMKILESEL